MLAAPASIACAEVGDMDCARLHLSIAEQSAARWEGSAWDGAVLEARAHLAAVEPSGHDATELAVEAPQLFAAAGHTRDAARCMALSGRHPSTPASMAPAGN